MGIHNFFYHQEGRQPLKMVDPSKEQRNRRSLKCGYKDRLTIVLRKSIDIFPRKWHVTIFVVYHNHELLSPSGVRFLSANQVITKDDKNYIILYKETGLSVREIIAVSNILNFGVCFVVIFIMYFFTKIVTIFHPCIYHHVGVVKPH